VPVAPRISAIETNGARVKRTRTSGPCLEPVRALRDARQNPQKFAEVGVIQKEAVDGAFRRPPPSLALVLELRDDVPDLQNEFRTHEVERWVVEYDSTV